jgi:hypothetical protein
VTGESVSETNGPLGKMIKESVFTTTTNLPVYGILSSGDRTAGPFGSELGNRGAGDDDVFSKLKSALSSLPHAVLLLNQSQDEHYFQGNASESTFDIPMTSHGATSTAAAVMGASVLSSSSSFMYSATAGDGGDGVTGGQHQVSVLLKFAFFFSLSCISNANFGACDGCTSNRFFVGFLRVPFFLYTRQSMSLSLNGRFIS